jgi:tetratricopeptide (TPR) repeat protein
MKKQRRTHAARAASATGVRDSRRRVWTSAAILVAAILLTYWNSIPTPFQFDDVLPVENEAARQSSSVDASQASGLAAQVAGRPVVRASFALNYALGGKDVTGYHVLNIAVHVACALLLFAIIRRTLSHWCDGELRQSATATALAATVIWAVHPLNTGTVTYVSARSESLMALCYLTTLFAGIQAYQSSRRSMWNAVAVAACACGMACKETMVTAPLVMVLFDRAVVFTSFKAAFAARWRLYAWLAATWIVLAALAWSAPRADSVGFSLGVSPWTYLLNQAEILAEYLRNALWPDRLVFAYGEPRAIVLRDVLPQALLIATLVALSFWAWRVRPTVGFLALAFFVILAPTSTIVPIATEVGAERRMYLPLAALVVLLVASTRAAWRTRPVARVALVAALAIGLGVLTIRRNSEYASAEALWRATLERWPSAIAHRNLATALRQVGKREEALEHLRATVTDHPEVHYILGLELFEMGRWNEALVELTTFLEGDAISSPDVEANARVVRGRTLAGLGRPTDAAQEVAGVVAKRPDDMDAQLALADVQLAGKEFGPALTTYRRYVSHTPGHVGAWTNLGIAAFSLGQVDEAIAAFQRAAELQPENASIHKNLAGALAESGRLSEATSHAADAARLNPGDSKARELYGRLLVDQRRYAEAERELTAARQIDPANQDVSEILNRLRRGAQP